MGGAMMKRIKLNLNLLSNNKILRMLTLVLSVNLILMGLWSVTIYGEELGVRQVKVAFFPMEGYNDLENGTYSGMDVEYLSSVCNYADWEIVYVPCDSWDEALFLLKEKKVDLVGSAQYSKERAKEYLYADLPSGCTYGVMAVNEDSNLAYEDFNRFRDCTFGVVKTYIRKNEFLEYMSYSGIKNVNLKEYNSTQELQQALSDGEIDAMVHSLTEIKSGQRIVGRFAPMPFYYITYQGNDKLMYELNQAISDVKINQPELENDLMYKYYQKKLDKSVVFDSTEKEYLKNLEKLKVGYIDECYPFSYTSNEDFKGLWRNELDKISDFFGVEFEYVRFKTEHDAISALEKKEIDVVNYCTLDEDELKEKGIVLTGSFVSIPSVIVTKKTTHKFNLKLGVADNLASEAVEATGVEENELQEYVSQKACLDAVMNGEVEGAVIDGYLAEYYLSSNSKYSSFKIARVLNTEHNVYMAIRDDKTDYLKHIFDKTLPVISDKQISEYILKDNIHTLQDISDLVKEYSPFIISFLLTLIFVASVTGVHMVKDSKKIQKLLYKDYSLDVWNMNYFSYNAPNLLNLKGTDVYAVVSINVSQFRLFNALYGWEAGQEVLKIIVKVLEKNINSAKEIYARNQSDHFVLLIREENEKALLYRLELLKGEIELAISKYTDNQMNTTMGVYFVNEENRDIEAAVSCANQAMDALHDMKDIGMLVYDDEFEKNLKEEHRREKILQKADFQKDFVVFYQAKVDIRTEKVIGAEALVRFIDYSDAGKIKSPFFFIPYFEKTGKVTEIDFFVMESVCKMLRKRLDEGKEVVTVSCNFSRHHFMKPGFTDRFETVIAKYDIPKELIEVEITETLVVEELQQQAIKRTINELRERGVRISIDDFGSGYSSLGVFEQIPASVIKLDRSFLLNREDRDRQVAIMKGIVHMAGDLDAQVVCEGVETENDVELMKEIGAYVAQGYRYAKPVPLAEFEAKLG